MKYNYKVIARWGTASDDRQEVGKYATIESAVKKQKDVLNQLPLSATNEVTVYIETIKHKSASSSLTAAFARYIAKYDEDK